MSASLYLDIPTDIDVCGSDKLSCVRRDRERRIREFGDRGGGGGGGGLGSLHFEKSSSSSSTTTSSWVNAEMGIGDDGSFSGHPGTVVKVCLLSADPQRRREKKRELLYHAAL